jgi:hypothetical protein
VSVPVDSRLHLREDGLFAGLTTETVAVAVCETLDSRLRGNDDKIWLPENLGRHELSVCEIFLWQSRKKIFPSVIPAKAGI